MYCAHFGLHRPPFNNTPDPAFYYGTSEHEEALATLEYATAQRKGFVLVTGDIGAGKTLIGRMFLRRIESRARTAIITHTHLNGRQLLAAICAEFELLTPPDASNLQLAEVLQTFLLEQFAQDRFVVVLLDEAQNLPDESFEAVRMLGNLEADDAKLLQICILGQPELRERFSQPAMHQLDQRLFRRFHLSTLSREQTAEYIAHRLRVAGCRSQELFTPAAVDRIHAHASGTPRVINRICDNALLTVYGRHGDRVDADVVDEVAGAPAPVLEPTAPGEAGLHKAVRTLPARQGAAPQAPAARPHAARTVAAHDVHQLTGRLDCSEESLRLLGQELSRQFQGLSERMAALEARTASSQDVEQARGECMQAVQDALRGLEAHSATLHELRGDLDRASMASAGGQQAQLDALGERIESQIRELHQLYRDASLSRSGVEASLDRLTREVTRGGERIEELDARVTQQRAGIEHLESRVAGGLASVERDLSTLREAAATRQELARSQSDYEAALQGLREEKRADLDCVQNRQEAALDALRADHLVRLEKLKADQHADLARLQEEKNADLEKLRLQHEAALEALRGEQLAQLEAHQTRHSEAMERLRGERGADLGEMRFQYQKSIEALRREHLKQAEELAARQAALLEELRQERGRELEQLRREQQAALEALRREHLQKAEDLEAQQHTAIERLRRERGSDVEQLRREQQAAVETLRQEHAAQLQELDARHATDLGTLRDQRHSDVQLLDHRQQAALDRVREEHQAALAALQDRQNAELELLRQQQRADIDSLRDEQVEAANWLQGEQAQTSVSLRQLHGVVDTIRAGLEFHGVRVDELGRKVEVRLGAFEQELGQLRSESATAGDLERWRLEHAAAIADLVNRLTQESEALVRFRQAVETQSAVMSSRQREAIAGLHAGILAQAKRLHGLRHRFAAWRENVHARLEEMGAQLEDRGRTLDELNGRLSERERELHALDARIADRLGGLEQALRDGLNRSADRAELENLREQHVAALSDVVDRLTSEAEAVRQLKDRMDVEAALASREKQQIYEQLSRRISRQAARIRAVQRRLLAWQENLDRQLSGLDRRFADREQFEQFQQSARTESREIHEHFEHHREAMEALIDGVAQRCRDVQDQINAVDLRKAGADELARLSELQAREAADLLARLEQHKQTVHDQLRMVLSQWERTQHELTRLTASAAPAHELAALRQRQDEDTTRMMAMLEARRSELEALLAGVSRRCDEFAARLQALPPDLVDADQLGALRQEHAEQLRIVCARIEQGRCELERATGELTNRCRQLEESVEDLAARAASAADIERLREDHTRELNELVGRLDRQGSAHQREVSELNERWAELARSVRSLAATVPSTGTIQEFEEAIAGNLSELRDRLDAAQRREREQLRSLVATVQRLSLRVDGVEQRSQPKPVTIELNPQAGRELAELNEQARREREQLAQAAERLEQARAAMEETSRRVDQSLARWQQEVAGVDRKAQELQASARSAAGLLNTMQRAQKVLDGKLNSQTWHEELTRGEALTGRLESVIREGAAVCTRLHAALRDFEQSRDQADLWSTRRQEAQEITQRLAELLSRGQRAGQRFEAELDQRRRVLRELARNTAGLADVIDAARRDDSRPDARPAHASRRGRTANGESHAGSCREVEKVSEVDWAQLQSGAARLVSRGQVSAPDASHV